MMLRLREIRENRGFTLRQLGDAVGKTEGAISHYETGRRNPDFETLLMMADVLNCSVDSILGNNFALTVDEEYILFYFRQLNDLGQRQLLKTARSFSEDPDMTEKNNSHSASETA